jgi:arsenate reductase (thioredoxin)
MAEALVTLLGEGRFKGFSAGSQPTGRVNPFAIELVEEAGYPVAQLRSKSWDEFARDDAPPMDFIITVCNNAAGETCPFWPGRPATAHWGFEDPAAVEGTDEQKRAAFARIFSQIKARMQLFSGLPLESMDAAAVREALDRIGRTPV